ncbi:hypothetical protein A1342_17690 [Methylomonas methanica]|uniref:Uncharacterized protein n=1 Tax=Methylomonas denitrificans TaxID=1538553 RepID=A0A126T2L4_9GAMM|nr:hypothetical protein JT25_007285 [Methylomonas denitrificans]OAI00736.1 hypothetical protein A1342_17690 [Methylomonas methanica]
MVKLCGIGTSGTEHALANWGGREGKKLADFNKAEGVHNLENQPLASPLTRIARYIAGDTARG